VLPLAHGAAVEEGDLFFAFVAGSGTVHDSRRALNEAAFRNNVPNLSVSFIQISSLGDLAEDQGHPPSLPDGECRAGGLLVVSSSCTVLLGSSEMMVKNLHTLLHIIGSKVCER
jgi:hypothetical protein